MLLIWLARNGAAVLTKSNHRHHIHNTIYSSPHQWRNATCDISHPDNSNPWAIVESSSHNRRLQGVFCNCMVLTCFLVFTHWKFPPFFCQKHTSLSSSLQIMNFFEVLKLIYCCQASARFGKKGRFGHHFNSKYLNCNISWIQLVQVKTMHDMWWFGKGNKEKKKD